MSDVETAVAAVLTVLTLLVVTARQLVGLRDDAEAPRWLSGLAGVLVLAFVIAMAMRLRTAL
jgi:hypothetical protein